MDKQRAHIVSVHVNFLTKREILKGTGGSSIAGQRIFLILFQKQNASVWKVLECQKKVISITALYALLSQSAAALALQRTNQ